MWRLLLIFLAGGFGSCLRHLLVTWTQRTLGESFPWGILGVNLVGSFLIALVMVFAVTRAAITPTVQVALTSGFIGGLTTYSSFNQDTLALLDNKQHVTALAYVGTTLLACLVAGVLGTWVGRHV